MQNNAPEPCLELNSDVSTPSTLHLLASRRSHRAFLQVILGWSIDKYTTKSIARHAAERENNVEDQLRPLHEMHKDVFERIDERRRRATVLQNAAKNFIYPKFVVGDFVAVCKPARPKDKLYFRWYGHLGTAADTGSLLCMA